MRKQFLIISLCTLAAIGTAVSGCGKYEDLYAGNEISFKIHRQGFSVIQSPRGIAGNEVLSCVNVRI